LKHEDYYYLLVKSEPLVVSPSYVIYSNNNVGSLPCLAEVLGSLNLIHCHFHILHY